VDSTTTDFSEEGRPVRKAAIALTAFLGGLLILLGVGSSTASAQSGEEALQGTLTSAGQPVPGVKIDVKAEGGAAVGSAVSDAQGKWRVPVPGSGRYEISLDTSTLPGDIGLVNDKQQTLRVQVFAGNVRTVLFRLAPGGGGEEGGKSKWDQVPQLLFDGVNFGLIIAMAALGLSLIYGTTGLTNFAHGELVSLGALAAFYFNVTIGMNLIPAAILAVIVAGAFGYLQDRFFWGWLRRRGTGLIAMMIVSIGLALVLRHLYLYFFGGQSRQFADYTIQAGLEFGPINVTPATLTGMAIEAVILFAVGMALLRTRLGKATRAVADNPSLAASSGIDVERVIRIVWTAGAAIAGLAGILLAMQQSVNYQMGFQILLLVFAGVILGGLGTAFGALVGSLLVGMMIQLSTLFIPEEMKNVGALLVLIIVLLFRPQGILGRAERVG
jgi:branched-chain amino acid transport system permease protein